MFTQFLPKTTTEWIYIFLIFSLLITLIVFYKGVMKCKSIIESYNSEIRDYNQKLTTCRDFITYVDNGYGDILPEYCITSDTSIQDFYDFINEVDNSNA